MKATTPLLAVSGLRKHFTRGGRRVTALDGLDLAIAPGETLALVGPSGSGKSTVGRLLLRLIEPDAGSIVFEGRDLLALRGEELRLVRPRLQMVFQDPLAAFNPRATVARVLADPLRVHSIGPRRDHAAAIDALLARVGLPGDLRDRRIHEISGGQRQRVAIARAIATNPSLIVLDEALTALDVSVRAGIIDLLRDLQSRQGMAYLFISHDLALVRAFADRVAIIDAGRIVETGGAAEMIERPESAMGRALLAAAPRLPRETFRGTAG